TRAATLGVRPTSARKRSLRWRLLQPTSAARSAISTPPPVATSRRQARTTSDGGSGGSSRLAARSSTSSRMSKRRSQVEAAAGREALEAVAAVALDERAQGGRGRPGGDVAYRFGHTKRYVVGAATTCWRRGWPPGPE